VSEETKPDFLQPPEFEARAERFIQAVRGQIAPRYQGKCLIVAENQTSRLLQRIPEVIKLKEGCGIEKERVAEFLKQCSDRLDQESAYNCRVGVTVSGGSEKPVKYASRQIEALAKKHNGKENPGCLSGIVFRSENDPWGPYCSNLSYIFGDEEPQ